MNFTMLFIVINFRFALAHLYLLSGNLPQQAQPFSILGIRVEVMEWIAGAIVIGSAIYGRIKWIIAKSRAGIERIGRILEAKRHSAPKQLYPDTWPLQLLTFTIVAAQDEIAKIFKPGLLRYAIIVLNGQYPQEIYDYWVEDVNGERQHRFLANRRLLPVSLAPNERHVFQYILTIKVSYQEEPKFVRACVQLDGPVGKTIRGPLQPMPVFTTH
jgi:hypothetical protein